MKLLTICVSSLLLLSTPLVLAQSLQMPSLVDWNNLKTQKLIQKKNQILVINFWATWCAPCRAEMPFLESIHMNDRKNTKKTKFRVIGIALDERTNIASFLKTTKVSYPIWQVKGDGVAWMKSMGNPIGGLPFTLMTTAECSHQETILGQITPEKWQSAIKNMGKYCTKK